MNLINVNKEVKSILVKRVLKYGGFFAFSIILAFLTDNFSAYFYEEVLGKMLSAIFVIIGCLYLFPAINILIEFKDNTKSLERVKAVAMEFNNSPQLFVKKYFKPNSRKELESILEQIDSNFKKYKRIRTHLSDLEVFQFVIEKILKERSLLIDFYKEIKKVSYGS